MNGQHVSSIIKLIEGKAINIDEVKLLLIDGDTEQKIELALHIGRKRITELLEPLMEALDMELEPEVRSVYYWAISLIAGSDKTEQLVKWIVEETDQECKVSMFESFFVFAERHNIDYNSIKVLPKRDLPQTRLEVQNTERTLIQEQEKHPIAQPKKSDNIDQNVLNILNQLRPNIPVALTRIAQLSDISLEQLEHLLLSLEITGKLPGEYLKLEQVFIRNQKKLVYTLCKTCGEPTKLYPCEFCGKGEVCSTCRLIIGIDHEVLSCPNCGASNHKKHLLEWVKIKGNCPSCRERLTTSQIA